MEAACLECGLRRCRKSGGAQGWQSGWEGKCDPGPWLHPLSALSIDARAGAELLDDRVAIGRVATADDLARRRGVRCTVARAVRNMLFSFRPDHGILSVGNLDQSLERNIGQWQRKMDGGHIVGLK